MRKPLLVSNDNHSFIMQYKAKLNLKNADEVISKMRESLKWEA
jgi:hypothetical protein